MLDPHTSSISAGIGVAGQTGTLTEYFDDVEHDVIASGNCKTAYIVAEDGKEFHIAIELLASCRQTLIPQDLQLHVFVDGNDCGNRVYSVSDCDLPFRTTRSHVAYSDSKGHQVQSNFKFSALAINEMNTTETQANTINIGSLGTIQIEVWSIKICPGYETIGLWGAPPTWITTLDEKAVKGHSVSHTASLSTPVSTRPPCHLQTQTLCFDPVAVFTWRYRSRKSLKMLRIIPRTPSPAPLEDRDLDELNAEELRELVRRQRDSARTVKTDTSTRPIVKRERARTGDENDKNGIEDESSGTPRKRPRWTNTIKEAIDLTD